ncbi:hypothetical protein KSP35_12290 [Aquihabitans sp. G128]|uniref:hypothetical protein n=1 Tax=Aquihabitans sp. G128 TaxID=2849779 RepID=UPI001C21C7A5|nr:hypothetical protein [Aquihabitans sp. G128]QXC59190.1 hypothetical protein KSP35_12290 [Aquihabitans sp. G128]
MGTSRARAANVEAAAAKRRGELDASGTPYASDAQLATLNASLVTARDQITSAVDASRDAKRAADAAHARATQARDRSTSATRAKDRTKAFDERIFSPAFGIADPLRPNPVDPPQVAAGKDALNKLFGGTVGAVANPQLEGDPPRK